jgi:hypothetical protein
VRVADRRSKTTGRVDREPSLAVGDVVGICGVLGADPGTPTEFLARTERSVTRYSDREVAVYAASHTGLGTAGPYHVGEALESVVGRQLGSIEPTVGRPERTTRTGLLPFYAERGIDRIALYGHEARALSDALSALGSLYEGEEVLLPALAPAVLAEAVRADGLTPRFYPLADDLGPAEAAAERFDDGVLAAILTHPFGRPQTTETVGAFAERCADHGAGLIEDATRAALSTRDGHAVGTSGDVGVLAFPPLFRIPNGAALLPGEGIRSAALRNASVNDGFTTMDARYGVSAALQVTTTAPLVSSLSRTLSPARPSRETDSTTAYASTDVSMSKLSRLLLDHVDPDWCVAARRANVAAWPWELADREGITPLFDTYPQGCCPSALPVLVESDTLADRLPDAWPSLDPEVLERDTYASDRSLAARVRLLPVGQAIDPETIGAVARAWLDE